MTGFGVNRRPMAETSRVSDGIQYMGYWIKQHVVPVGFQGDACAIEEIDRHIRKLSEAVRFLLSHELQSDLDKDDLDALVLGSESDAINPEHVAAYYGHVQLTRYLVEKRAECHRGFFFTQSGHTVLSIAASQGHTSLVKAMIDDGYMARVYDRLYQQDFSEIATVPATEHSESRYMPMNLMSRYMSPLLLAAQYAQWDVVALLFNYYASRAGKSGYPNQYLSVSDLMRVVDDSGQKGLVPNMYRATTRGEKRYFLACDLLIEDYKQFGKLMLSAPVGLIHQYISFLDNPFEWLLMLTLFSDRVFVCSLLETLLAGPVFDRVQNERSINHSFHHLITHYLSECCAEGDEESIRVFATLKGRFPVAVSSKGYSPVPANQLRQCLEALYDLPLPTFYTLAYLLCKEAFIPADMLANIDVLQLEDIEEPQDFLTVDSFFNCIADSRELSDEVLCGDVREAGVSERLFKERLFTPFLELAVSKGHMAALGKYLSARSAFLSTGTLALDDAVFSGPQVLTYLRQNGYMSLLLDLFRTSPLEDPEKGQSLYLTEGSQTAHQGDIVEMKIAGDLLMTRCGNFIRIWNPKKQQQCLKSYRFVMSPIQSLDFRQLESGAYEFSLHMGDGSVMRRGLDGAGRLSSMDSALPTIKEKSPQSELSIPVKGVIHSQRTGDTVAFKCGNDCVGIYDLRAKALLKIHKLDISESNIGAVGTDGERLFVAHGNALICF